MNKSAYAYLTAVAIGAITLLLGLLVTLGIPAMSSREYLGLFVFAALGVLSEALALDFTVGPNRQAQSSIAFLPLFACMLVYAPLPATLAAMLVALTTELFFRKPLLWRTVFNTSQYVLSYGAAACIYYFISNKRILSTGSVDFAAFWALAICFFVTNVVIISILMALRGRVTVGSVLREAIGPTGGNLLVDLLASPLAVFTAILYGKLYIWGLFLIIVPLLLVRYSYLSTLKLAKVNKDLLTVLVKAIETRDPYTSGHSMRVAALARTVAEDLGLSRRLVERVERSALLHDIGKIDALYTTLISKPYDLTAEERSLIRTHATKGAELLLSLSAFGQEIISAVRHHHERFDGTGYPDGLSGVEIPLASRIIMLCDSIDAMLSDRPYRSALSIEQAHSELTKFAGAQFDPTIVDVIITNGTLNRAVQLVDRPGQAPLYLSSSKTA